MTNTFLKYSGVSRQFAASREANIKSFSELLYQALDTGDAAQALRTFDRYGISAKEVEVLKNLASDQFDEALGGMKIISVEKIDNIPDSALKDLVPKGVTVSQYRNQLSRKYHGMLLDASKLGAVSPDASVKVAATWGGFPEDSFVGQFARTSMQFKSFPMQMYNVGSRILNANPNKATSARLMAEYLLSLTAMGYTAYSLKQLARGKELVDPLDKDEFGKVLARSFVQGGAGSLVGDFVFGEYHRHYRSFAEDLAGPGISMVGEAIALGQKTIFDGASYNDIKGFAINNAPFNNVFYATAAWEHGLKDVVNDYIMEIE